MEISLKKTFSSPLALHASNFRFHFSHILPSPATFRTWVQFSSASCLGNYKYFISQTPLSTSHHSKRVGEMGNATLTSLLCLPHTDPQRPQSPAKHVQFLASVHLHLVRRLDELTMDFGGQIRADCVQIGAMLDAFVDGVQRCFIDIDVSPDIARAAVDKLLQSLDALLPVKARARASKLNNQQEAFLLRTTGGCALRHCLMGCGKFQ